MHATNGNPVEMHVKVDFVVQPQKLYLLIGLRPQFPVTFLIWSLQDLI